jgi:membrane protein DedA with SNARE-associated domain
MRFKLGLLIGLGVGYYFGAKAGRPRYEQIERWLTRARQSGLSEAAGDKARAVVDLSVVRAKEALSQN